MGQWAGAHLANPYAEKRFRSSQKIPASVVSITQFLTDLAIHLSGEDDPRKNEEYSRGLHAGIKNQLDIYRISDEVLAHLRHLISKREIDILQLMSPSVRALFSA